MEKVETPIPGCYEIRPRVLRDARGSFTKVFHAETYQSWGLEAAFTEEYYSWSKEGCLRGMHFQTPPRDHAKLVYCISGSVIDVAVDLRIGSPTFGKVFSLELSDEKANALYLPRGMAHGFCVPKGNATMIYKVTSSYSPEHDSGILWSSIPFEWPTQSPILSPRDASFVKIQDFKSPFQYSGSKP